MTTTKEINIPSLKTIVLLVIAEDRQTAYERWLTYLPPNETENVPKEIEGDNIASSFFMGGIKLPGLYIKKELITNTLGKDRYCDKVPPIKALNQADLKLISVIIHECYHIVNFIGGQLLIDDEEFMANTLDYLAPEVLRLTRYVNNPED